MATMKPRGGCAANRILSARLIPAPIAIRVMLSISFALSMLMVTGCGGCNNKPKTAAQKKKEQEEEKRRNEEAKPKEDFEVRNPVVMPAVFPDYTDDEPVDPEETEKERIKRIEDRKMEARKYNRAKPGHWYTAYFQVIANNFNAQGELNCTAVDVVSSGVPVEGTKYVLRSTRPASLPKGEWRNLEATIYQPRRNSGTPSVKYELRSAAGLPITSFIQGTQLMEPFQFHFVVLSHTPDQYGYLNDLHVNRIVEPNTIGEEMPQFYVIVNSRDGDPVPLPRQALNWTTIAYVLWDDYAANEITEEHQTALLDWIHHGGQLIVSGPDSLDKLRTGFLADYLPAEPAQAKDLQQDDFAALNETWSIPDPKTNDARGIAIDADRPVLGLELNLHEDGRFIPGTGELLAERRLGRGRIVLSAFSLTDRKVVYWKGFDSLFNGAILRRPGRKFGFSHETNSLTFRWRDDETSVFDPLVGSNLRYLSRDLGVAGTAEQIHFEKELSASGNAWGMGGRSADFSVYSTFLMRDNVNMLRNRDEVLRYGGYSDSPGSGVAGWNDFSGVSNASREMLKQGAGISPPPASFVLKTLAAYLVILVPLNWLIFRMIGKVEWAWIAAPLIAIAGTIAVIKLAALDIGFVRSNTQVSLLEVNAGYPRAHFAEYSALYTSLSANYSAELENQTAQSLPFALQNDATVPVGENTTVRLNRTRANRLEGFQIQSNSTGMLHTESMIDIGGTLTVSGNDAEGWVVSNGTAVDLVDAGVIYRDQQGELKTVFLGELSSGASAPLEGWNAVGENEVAGLWNQVERFTSDDKLVRRLWSEIASGEEKATLSSIRNHPSIAPHWDSIRRVAMREDLPFEEGGSLMSREQFSYIYKKANIRDEENVGAVFDAVVFNLGLEKGAMKLISSCRESPGKTSFVPESTRNLRQTLVVAHLKNGAFQEPVPDKNYLSDALKRDFMEGDE